MLLYRSKKPLHRTVGVKRLVLVCPREEIGNCESTGTAALSEDSNRPSADPGSRRKNTVDRSFSRTPSSGRENTCEDKSLRTPGSGSKNVESINIKTQSRFENMNDAIKSLQTPGCRERCQG